MPTATKDEVYDQQQAQKYANQTAGTIPRNNSQMSDYDRQAFYDLHGFYPDDDINTNLERIKQLREQKTNPTPPSRTTTRPRPRVRRQNTQNTQNSANRGN